MAPSDAERGRGDTRHIGPPHVTRRRGSLASALALLGEDPTLTIEERAAKLRDIADQVRTCSRCGLHQERTNAVPGLGSVAADVFFVGEGPGEREDREGLPFVGRSGRYLDQLMDGVGLNRSAVFITNVVKCRPPSNRDPRAAEVHACAAYLERQLALVRPRLVVTLGRFAMEHFFPLSLIHI